MDVDTAITEAPVNLVALTDDTDFKTRETGIVYNQAGMDLVWNFVTTAGVYTQTAVTPTTAGDYDWAHQGDGMYSIEIPASGGASINNDTEGFGWFTGICTGVLHWRGPVIGFRAAGINNLLIDNAYSETRGLAGTALPAAAADAAGGLPISDAGGLDLDTQIGADIDAILVDTNSLNDTKIPQTLNLTASGNIGIDWANVENPTTALDLSGTDIQLCDTVTTLTGHTAQTGDSFARLGAPAGASVSADILAIDNFVDDLESRLTAARAGYLDELAAANIPADIDTLLGRLTAARAGYLDNINTGSGLTAIPWNAAWDAEVESEAQDAIVANKLDHLVAVADADDPVDNSIIAKLANSGATADWSLYDNTSDSLMAIRDRGDAAWITGGGGSITEILNIQPLIPQTMDLADTATVRIGLGLTNMLDDLPSTAEISPGTIAIDRKAAGGASWTNIVNDAACSEAAGLVYYDEVFDSGTGYAEGDSIRITFKSQKITVAANDFEITGADGWIFHTYIRQDAALVKRILGLTHENFRIKNQVYNTNNKLTSATIRIYGSAADCANDTSQTAEYTITATYDSDSNCNSYTSVKA